ncbi:hypothetical protein ABPG72_015842 [Tetrahymena utriculariae]
MSVNLQFMDFVQNVSDGYYSQNHGWKILQFLIIEALDSKGILEEFDPMDEDQFKIFLEDQFILILIKQFQISQQSPEKFLKFISYQYMSQQLDIYRDVTQDILSYLENTDCIDKYIYSKKNQKSKNIQQIQQPLLYQQQHKLQQQQNQSINAINNFPNDSVRNNQQINNHSQFNKSQNQYNTLSQNLSDYQKQGLLQTDQIPQRQNQPQLQSNIQQSQASSRQQSQLLYQFTNQKNIIQSKEGSNDAKFAYFENCKKQSEQIKDCISHLTQLQQKYTFLEFNHDFSVFNGLQFRCFYESISLQIQKVFSSAFSKKKDAQHDAAKKFLPHVLFYLKYKQPYFEDDDQEMMFLEQIKEKNQAKKEQEREEPDSIHNKIRQDLLLQTSYDDEIQGVTLIVQQHEKNNLQEVLKWYDSQELNYFKCTVTFQKNNKVIFSQCGFGSSKKYAKQVAFMKISPLISNFYNPDIQIIPPRQSSQRKNIPQSIQQHLDMFNYQVRDQQDIDY